MEFIEDSTIIDRIIAQFPQYHNSKSNIYKTLRQLILNEDEPKEAKPKEDKPKEDKPEKYQTKRATQKKSAIVHKLRIKRMNLS